MRKIHENNNTGDEKFYMIIWNRGCPYFHELSRKYGRLENIPIHVNPDLWGYNFLLWIYQAVSQDGGSDVAWDGEA